MPDREMRTKPSPVGRPDHVLFFAAIPPPDIKALMARAWQTFGTGQSFRHDTLHLTIYPVAAVNDVDPALVKRARQAANFLRTAPFTLCFDRLARFNGGPISYPIVITTEKTSHELDDVAAELHSSCRAMGITASRSTKVTPHVTLAHGPGFSEIRLLDKPILWNIDEITLIDSLQGKGRHVSLGKWPLPKDRQQRAFDF